MKRAVVAGILGLGVPAAVALLVWPGSTSDFDAAEAAGRVQTVDRPAAIRPDYTDATIPPNIAPLNFSVLADGTHYRVTIRAEQGEPIRITSRSAQIVIPVQPWRDLLEANRGGPLSINICVRAADGRWRRFQPITNTIARDDIDPYLVYRLMRPIFSVYERMGIYQRNLTTYDQSPVLTLGPADNTCVNCHSFAWNSPKQMSLHIRGQYGAVMVLARDGRARKVDTRTTFNRGPVAYTSWHPNGRVVAFSANQLFQVFNSAGETRDVIDEASDLVVYDTATNAVTTTPGIASPDRLETFPAWSADGRDLYFCSTAPFPVKRFREVRYDLMRIGYDPDTGRWGEVETVLAAKDTGLSITEPKVSPDGRFVLFCMAPYGSFPVYQPECDLYLLNLKTRRCTPLACNSPEADSWHSWSSNSRWIAFASKRRDGVFARLYLSHIDDAGRAGKAVLVPQQDPTFYDSLIKTYNRPELVRGPVPVTRRELSRTVRSDAEPRTSHLDARARRLKKAGRLGRPTS